MPGSWTSPSGSRWEPTAGTRTPALAPEPHDGWAQPGAAAAGDLQERRPRRRGPVLVALVALLGLGGLGAGAAAYEASSGDGTPAAAAAAREAAVQPGTPSGQDRHGASGDDGDHRVRADDGGGRGSTTDGDR